MHRRGFLGGLFAGSVATALPAHPLPVIEKTDAEKMAELLEQMKVMSANKGHGSIGNNMTVCVSHWSSRGGNWSA